MFVCVIDVFFFFFFFSSRRRHTRFDCDWSSDVCSSDLVGWWYRFVYSPRRLEAIGWQVSRVTRSEEHTSELQSQSNLVCRLLLEKKNRRRRAAPGSVECRSRGALRSPGRRLPSWRSR